MINSLRFDRAIAAARDAFGSRDWLDTIAWQEAAWHAYEEEILPAVEAGEVTGLLAHRLRSDAEESLTLAARARLAVSRGAPQPLLENVRQLEDMIVRAPGREELRRLLMVAHARLDDPESALEVFSEAAEYSASTTGLEPSQSMRQIADLLLAGEPLPIEDEDRAFIVASRRDGDSVIIPLSDARETTVGRADDRDLAISWDPAVSRHHAEFRPTGDRHVVADVGSSNGTRLNGRSLATPLELRDGDVVSIGSTMIIYRNPAGAPAVDVSLMTGTRIGVMPSPSSMIKQEDLQDESDTLDVTIFFCDLRGYTSASGSVTPQRAREILDVFYDLGSAIVNRHGGTVLQMAGDEIYACFGAPVEQPDHARRAFDAARDLQAREAFLAAELEARGLPAVRFGIGLNSGPVAPFAIGTADRKQLGLVGTTVNVAARLCSEAGAGEIVYSNELRARAPDLGEGTPTGVLNLKNVAQEVQAWRVLP